MSTDYMIAKGIRAVEMFDGRLEKYGVREAVYPANESGRKRFLTDGNNRLEVYICEEGLVYSANRSGLETLPRISIFGESGGNWTYLGGGKPTVESRR